MNTPALALAFLVLTETGKPVKAVAAYDDLFRKYANNPRLAKTIGIVESDLNPDAIGDQGRAFGLMQIWHSTAKGHGYTGGAYGLLDPEKNVYYATCELNHLVSVYGFYRGIMGYNLGETRLRKGASNNAYLNKVLKYYGGVTLT